MNYLPQETPSGTKLNLDALYQLFPQCFTETRDEATGELRRVINFTSLRQVLGDEAVEDMPEAYEFTWVGKQDAKREAAKPIRKTLRPCKEESVDWDTTQNLYIEGDNLEVLKLLQKSYMGKVKVIYIDPPYNTGNDFIYHDDFSMTQAEYIFAAGNVDEEGYRYRKNTETNGKFHSEWCSMMYTRLLVARSLLKEDGVIFISIDDNEFETLTMICNEVFGENCFITDVAWRSSDSSNHDAKQFSADYNHTLVYSRDPNWQPQKLERTEKNNQHYTNPDNDPRGPWFSGNVSSPNPRKNLMFDIIAPNGNHIHAPKNGWRWAQERINEMIRNGEIVFSQDNTRIIKKTFLKDQGGIVPSNFWWNLEETGHNRNAKYELKKLFPELPTSEQFSTPKPTKLIERILRLSSDSNSLVLDFFSGSATTAHAVMKLNAEDSGNRTFILVNLPEKTETDSEAYRAGYCDICDIAKERIRRAGKKIKEENPLMVSSLDTGFRVFKCAESNMKDVYYQPKDYNQNMLLGLLDNVKEDRTDLDLLCGCMLDWGVELSLPFRTEQVDACHIHIVNEGDLVACFDRHVTDHVIERIATLNPLRVVFRDSCFEGAAEKMNLFELFKQKCGWNEEEALNNIRVI